MQNKLTVLNSALKKRKQEEPVVFWSFLVFQLGTAAAFIHSIRQRIALYAVICVIQTFLLCLPWILEKAFRIHLSVGLKIMFMAYIYMCIAMGTVFDFYYRTNWFDLLCHTMAGVLFAGVGFALYETFHGPSSQPLKAGYRVLVAFGFSMATAVVWELFEFSMFYFFDMDMQRDTVLTSFATSYFTGHDAVSDVINVTTMSINNGEYIIDGYLDIGFIDTLTDMIVHVFGTLLFCVASLIGSDKWKQSFSNLFIPKSTRSATNQNEEALAAEASPLIT